MDQPMEQNNCAQTFGAESHHPALAETNLSQIFD
jgi:hypothetical protein